MSVSTQKYVAPKPQKKKKAPKQMSHSELAANWAANGSKFVEPEKKGWTKAEISQAQARGIEEKERAKAGPTKKSSAPAEEQEQLTAVLSGPTASERARSRMEKLAAAMETATVDDAGGPSSNSEDDLQTLADCRRSQLEELTLVEAMFMEEYHLISNAESVDQLREILEDDDELSEEALQLVAAHPPLEFALQMTCADDPSREGVLLNQDGTARELEASVLVRVRFPRLYPNPGTPPVLYVEDAMITENLAMAPDKLLSTIGGVDDKKLIAAMLEQGAEVQPDPCVHEMASWMAEHLWEHVSIYG